MRKSFNKAATLLLSLAIMNVIFPVNAAEKKQYETNIEIENNKLQVDDEGNAVLELVCDSNSGFVKNNGKTEFYDVSGRQAKSSWINISGKWYYFDLNGIMVTGWQRISNKWYYFLEDGSKVTGWLMDENHWYYLGEDGMMKSSQWVNIDGSWYYFNEKGIMEKDTIIDGFKINSNGILELKL